MKKTSLILCNTDVLYPRLKNKGINNPIYWLAFSNLIKFLQSNSGIVRDSDLGIIWDFVSERTRYRILKEFSEQEIINYTSNKQAQKLEFKLQKNLDQDVDSNLDADKRCRCINLLIEYEDTLYTVFP